MEIKTNNWEDLPNPQINYCSSGIDNGTTWSYDTYPPDPDYRKIVISLIKDIDNISVIQEYKKDRWSIKIVKEKDDGNPFFYCDSSIGLEPDNVDWEDLLRSIIKVGIKHFYNRRKDGKAVDTKK